MNRPGRSRLLLGVKHGFLWVILQCWRRISLYIYTAPVRPKKPPFFFSIFFWWLMHAANKRANADQADRTERKMSDGEKVKLGERRGGGGVSGAPSCFLPPLLAPPPLPSPARPPWLTQRQCEMGPNANTISDDGRLGACPSDFQWGRRLAKRFTTLPHGAAGENQVLHKIAAPLFLLLFFSVCVCVCALHPHSTLSATNASVNQTPAGERFHLPTHQSRNHLSALAVAGGGLLLKSNKRSFL